MPGIVRDFIAKMQKNAKRAVGHGRLPRRPALDPPIVTCNNSFVAIQARAGRSKTRAGAKPAPGKERVRKHRASLRARGLRPVQIWVPDTRRPGFAKEVRRQCLALRNDPQEKDVLAFIERAMDYSGWS